MMDYSDFYDIMCYASENWKGCYSQKEIACNAYYIYSDFLWLKANKITESFNVRTLYENLAEDVKSMPDNEEAKHWLNMISKELRW